MNLLEHFLLIIEYATEQTPQGDEAFDFVFGAFAYGEAHKTISETRLIQAFKYYEGLPRPMDETIQKWVSKELPTLDI